MPFILKELQEPVGSSRQGTLVCLMPLFAPCRAMRMGPWGNCGLKQRDPDPTKPSAEDQGPDSETQTLRDKNLQLIFYGLITCTSQDTDILKKYIYMQRNY